MNNYTYLLYLHIDHTPHDDEIIFLGSSNEPDLYYKALLTQFDTSTEGVSIVSENKYIIAVWKNLVKTELSSDEIVQLDDAFMKGNINSYTLKHMTLRLKKVQSFDSYY